MSFFGSGTFGGHFFPAAFWGGATIAVGDYPCHADTPTTGGLRGTGINPDGTDFPFIAPSDDVAHILADACLTHEVRAVALPLRVAWMFGFDKAVNCGEVLVPGDAWFPPDWFDEGWFDEGWFGASPLAPVVPTDYAATHDVDILIVDAADAVIFDSTLAGYYSGQAFGPRLRVHEWRTGQAALKVVQHTAVQDPADYRLLPETITPADGRLDERVSELLPRRASTLNGARQHVNLVAGDRVTLAVEQVDSGLRKEVTRITIGADPGGGDCDLVLRRINGVGGDATGNVTLAGDGCYWVRPPSSRTGAETALVPAATQIGSDCAPCCECEDFELAQQGVLGVWDIYQAAADLANPTVVKFVELIGRWEEQRSCRESRTVRMTALGFRPYVELAVAVANSTAECLRDVELTITLASEPTTATIAVVPRSTIKTDGLGGVATYELAHDVEAHTLTAFWDMLPPRVAVSVRTRLHVYLDRMTHHFGPGTVVLTLTAAATVAGVPLSGTATATVTV